MVLCITFTVWEIKLLRKRKDCSQIEPLLRVTKLLRELSQPHDVNALQGDRSYSLIISGDEEGELRSLTGEFMSQRVILPELWYPNRYVFFFRRRAGGCNCHRRLDATKANVMCETYMARTIYGVMVMKRGRFLWFNAALTRKIDTYVSLLADCYGEFSKYLRPLDIRRYENIAVNKIWTSVFLLESSVSKNRKNCREKVERCHRLPP